MKKTLGLVFLLIIMLIPMAVKKSVNENIEERITFFEQRGVNVKIVSEEGYFSSKRNFELTIKDANKFANYIGGISSSLNHIASFMKDGKSNLEGLVFKGDIENSNINYFADIKANIYLDTVGDEDKKDKNGPYSVIVDKKLLNFDLLFTNKGIFKKAKLKDIDEEFVFEKGKGNLKISGQKLINYSTDKRIEVETILDRFMFSMVEKYGKFKTSFEDLEYSLDVKNQLIGKGNFSLKDFQFSDDSFVFKFDSIYTSSEGKLKDAKYSLENELKLSKLTGKNSDINEKLNIENLKIKFDFSRIDYVSLEKLKESYAKSEEIFLNDKLSKAEFLNKYDKQLAEVFKNLEILLNKGLSLKVDASLDKFSFGGSEIEFLDIDLDAKLKENNLNTLTRNPFGFLNFLDVDGEIVIDEKGFETISAFSGGLLAMMLNDYIKKDAKKLIFDIKFKDGNLSINNKKLL